MWPEKFCHNNSHKFIFRVQPNLKSGVFLDLIAGGCRAQGGVRPG